MPNENPLLQFQLCQHAFGPQTGVVTLVRAYWAGSLTMALNSE